MTGWLVPQTAQRSPDFFARWQLESPAIYSIVDFLQLNRVYTSPWFLVLMMLVGLSLLVSILEQIRKNIQQHNTVPSTSFGNWESINPVRNPDSGPLIRFMQQRRYNYAHTNNHVYVFSKYSFIRWAGVFFHLGLLLVVIAGLVGLAFEQRGFVQAIEGEVLEGTEDEFLVTDLGVLRNGFDPGFKLFLKKFSHEYWEDTGQIKWLKSEITLVSPSGGGLNNTVAPNHPVSYQGVRLHQSFDYGFALGLLLTGPGGRERLAYFMLDHAKNNKEPSYFKSVFPLSDYMVEIIFYPDVSKESYYLKQPIANLRFTRTFIRKPVFDGLVFPGSVVRVEDNFLRFVEVKRWSGLIYEKSPDMFLAYAGLLVICLSASCMYFLPPRQIYIALHYPEILVSGRAKRFQPLFRDELERLVREMRKEWT